MLTLHQGHQPETEIIDKDNALQDLVIHLEAGVRIYGSAIYEDVYRKENGTWKICATGYRRIFEAVEPLGEGQGHDAGARKFREHLINLVSDPICGREDYQHQDQFQQ